MPDNSVETTREEYKSSLEFEKPKSWLKSVSAFANTLGGHIFFGYDDDTHEAIGLVDPQRAASIITYTRERVKLMSGMGTDQFLRRMQN